MLMAFSTLQPPPGDGFELKGKNSLISTPAGRNVLVDFSPEWYGPERGGSNYWSWAPGTATLLITNPHPAPLRVRLRFSLSSKGSRMVWVRVNGGDAWLAALSDDNQVSASLSHVMLTPGVNHVEFSTDAPAQPIPPDVRQFAFCLHNLRIDLQGLDPVPAPIK